MLSNFWKIDTHFFSKRHNLSAVQAVLSFLRTVLKERAWQHNSAQVLGAKIRIVLWGPGWKQMQQWVGITHKETIKHSQKISYFLKNGQIFKCNLILCLAKEMCWRLMVLSAEVSTYASWFFKKKCWLG